MSRSDRAFLFPVVLAILVITAAVVLSEIASRTLRLFVCDARGPVFHIPQADYGWTHLANNRIYSHGCIGRRYEFRTLVETNSRGLRDREYSYQRVAGLPRVLVLGDSVTEAAQVPVADTFSERIETGFAAVGTPVEVINAGVAGFGTDNELLFFRAEGRKYAPDVVVAVFNVQNDVAENSEEFHALVNPGPAGLPKSGIRLDPAGRLLFDTRPFSDFAVEGERRRAATNELAFWLHENFYLYRWAKRHLEARAPVVPAATAGFEGLKTQADLAGVFAEPPSPSWAQAWKLTEALYRELAKDVRASGAEFVVVIVPQREEVVPQRWAELLAMLPHLDGVSWNLDYPRRRMSDFLEREGVAFVDATAAMRDAYAASGRPGFYTWDPHPDADGHATLTEVMAPALREALAQHARGSGLH